jgi:hypothetical protein
MPLSGSSPLDDPTVIVCGPPAQLVPPTPPSAASTCGAVPRHHRTLPPRYRHLRRHRWSWLQVRHWHPKCTTLPPAPHVALAAGRAAMRLQTGAIRDPAGRLQQRLRLHRRRLAPAFQLRQ